MIFQSKVDRAMKKIHEDKQEKDGHLTEEEVESVKESLEWKDILAMTISALMVFLPVALIVLVLLALAGYFFVVH